LDLSRYAPDKADQFSGDGDFVAFFMDIQTDVLMITVS